MGRNEAPIEPGPLFEFATGLRALRRAAGSPPYRRLQRTAGFSASALADAASGRRLPTWEVTAAYVRACGGELSGQSRNAHAMSASPTDSQSAVTIYNPLIWRI